MASTNDPFDFSRLFGNMSGFSLPGLVTPTLDIDELDKKIKDLKAVEGWLSMNLSMLQMSIQGLEVQRNTLSSIKAMGEAFNKGMEEAQQPRKSPESTVPPTPAPTQEAASAAAETAATSEGPGKPIWPWELAAQAMQGLQEQLHQAGQQISEAQKPSATQKAAGRKTPNKASTQKAAAKSAERTEPTQKAATSTTKSAATKKPSTAAKKPNTPTK